MESEKTEELKSEGKTEKVYTPETIEDNPIPTTVISGQVVNETIDTQIQKISGNYAIGHPYVRIDGGNNRIIISDGTTDRILIGYQKDGF